MPIGNRRTSGWYAGAITSATNSTSWMDSGMVSRGATRNSVRMGNGGGGPLGGDRAGWMMSGALLEGNPGDSSSGSGGSGYRRPGWRAAASSAASMRARAAGGILQTHTGTCRRQAAHKTRKEPKPRRHALGLWAPALQGRRCRPACQTRIGLSGWHAIPKCSTKGRRKWNRGPQSRSPIGVLRPGMA